MVIARVNFDNRTKSKLDAFALSNGAFQISGFFSDSSSSIFSSLLRVYEAIPFHNQVDQLALDCFAKLRKAANDEQSL